MYNCKEIMVKFSVVHFMVSFDKSQWYVLTVETAIFFSGVAKGWQGGAFAPPSQISVLTQLSLALNNFFCQPVPTPRYARVLKLLLGISQ